MAEKLSFGIGPLVGAVYHALSPRARLRTSPENVADVLAACATVDRPLGCALAMRVMQSEMYRELDAAERADCDELVRQNLEWFKRDSAAGHSTSEFSNLSTQAHGYGVRVVDLRQQFEAWTKRQPGDEMALDGARWGVSFLYSDPLTQAAWIGYQGAARDMEAAHHSGVSGPDQKTF